MKRKSPGEQGEGAPPERVDRGTPTPDDAVIVDVVVDDAGGMDEFDGRGDRRGGVGCFATGRRVGEQDEARTNALASGRKDVAAGVAQDGDLAVNDLEHQRFDLVQRV